MHALRHRLRSFTWLALFAVLGLALAPSVSRALVADPSANPWAQICTTPGAGSDAPALPGTLAHGDHCPLCSHGAGPLGMPPAATVPPTFDDAHRVAAPSAAPPTARAPAWPAAQPRAPPLDS